MSKKYFGTDGIRGLVGESKINPEFVLKLGWAIGMTLCEEGDKILIGKDTRVSGYIMESVLEAGLASAGVGVRLLGPMPTPAVAYLTRAFRARAGIVISASHNPYYDNGIKIFAGDGTKLPDTEELAIEKKLEQPMKMVAANKLGKVKRYNDAPGRYVEFCKSTFGGFNSSLTGMKVVVDCANGATYHIAPRVLAELDAEVIELNVEPNGFNINEDCGSTKPEFLRNIVLSEKADLGIAFDGDGDRVIMVDNKGEVIDGDQILFITAKHSFAKGILSGGVVGTVMSNLGLEHALNKLKINFERSKVGDRYVMEALKKKNWLLGGEPSGHIVNLGITTTGDGIISSLQVLAAMYHYGKTLNELKNEMIMFPQANINIKISKIINVEKEATIQNAIKAAEKQLGSCGRVVLRSSGTEPLIRIMVESDNDEQAHQIARDLAAVVESVATGI
jgi:phosphoglucosamine mutase